MSQSCPNFGKQIELTEDQMQLIVALAEDRIRESLREELKDELKEEIFKDMREEALLALGETTFEFGKKIFKNFFYVMGLIGLATTYYLNKIGILGKISLP